MKNKVKKSKIYGGTTNKKSIIKNSRKTKSTFNSKKMAGKRLINPKKIPKKIIGRTIIIGERPFYKLIKNISHRKTLTREEMWWAIRKKYPCLDTFRINCKYKEWSSYIKREYLFDIIIEMKIHKSRHLSKEQKLKVEYELNIKALEKL